MVMLMFIGIRIMVIICVILLNCSGIIVFFDFVGV